MSRTAGVAVVVDARVDGDVIIERGCGSVVAAGQEHLVPAAHRCCVVEHDRQSRDCRSARCQPVVARDGGGSSANMAAIRVLIPRC
ncbi:hypothetical protein ACFWAY_34360 [Rhodococcus sp. NPDC059968]|uniref:hypothetical protein n=1 Tax=Rhodococcus sp. NPDC059968 TaxID=3347017 RepID=UPI00366DEB9A